MRCITNEKWRNSLIWERHTKTGASLEQIAADFASCEVIVEARLWSEFAQMRLFTEEIVSGVPDSVEEDAEAIWVGTRFGLPDGSITWSQIALVLNCPVDRVGSCLVMRWRDLVKREFAGMLRVHRSGRARRG